MQILPGQAMKVGANDWAVTPSFPYLLNQAIDPYFTLLSLFLPYVSLLFLHNISSSAPAKLALFVVRLLL